MEAALPEGLTVFNFPDDHRKRLWTSNLAERVNKEIKRRTKTVGIFPYVASCERLVTALLIGIYEEWLQGKTYLVTEENN